MRTKFDFRPCLSSTSYAFILPIYLPLILLKNIYYIDKLDYNT